jgi:hypothetical protein
VIPAASRPSNAGVVGGAMSRDSAMRIPQSGVRAVSWCFLHEFN